MKTYCFLIVHLLCARLIVHLVPHVQLLCARLLCVGVVCATWLAAHSTDCTSLLYVRLSASYCCVCHSSHHAPILAAYLPLPPPVTLTAGRESSWTLEMNK
jgi:hypothetical protein